VLEQDDPPEDDIEIDVALPIAGRHNRNNASIGEEEGSLNISESNDDSMHEIKKVTAIPILKNNDKFKSKSSKEAPRDSLNRFN
jgi:hypothetical protein